MKNFFKLSLIILVGTLFSTAAIAQQQQQQMPPQPEPLSPEEVTDEQLEMVSNVTKAGQGIQEEADTKMREVVADVDMEFQRFQQIMMAQQNPQMAGQLDLSEEEQQTLQQIQPQLMQISQETQQKYIAKIQEEGLTIQKFQQITQAIQAHPEVAERFEEINAEEDEGDGDDGDDG
ncbi:DUF4168 domain-containing protein [Gracilimonas sp.]|uniref:DUF4168 domain-containing protein n=1 Tax=Gracilimonas sp. TaxID=1974203 RepID=UPI002870BFD8|nr:DUF4168 domain-containing protein [Gracilimonas sp.]